MGAYVDRKEKKKRTTAIQREKKNKNEGEHTTREEWKESRSEWRYKILYI